MRDNGKEDARKRGGGINEGGHSDGRLRYMYFDAKDWDRTCYNYIQPLQWHGYVD